MTMTNIDLSEIQDDLLRSIAEAVLQLITEVDVDAWSVPGAMNAAASAQPGATATVTDVTRIGKYAC